MAASPPLVVTDPFRKPSSLLGLAERAVTGDMEATAQLLKALAPSMIRAARALMGSTHPELDDVVQQAMIGLVQALPAFRGDCSPHHYASRIVVRMAVAARQRSKLRGDRRDESIDLNAVPGSQPSLPDHVTAERRRSLVRSLLTQLPAEQAETLALRVALGFSLGEVAAATAVPLNTVRSRIRLAKQALRKRIDADPQLQLMLEVES
jgi:RNA polymerase sigma-70 factor (ECF subfamily)